MIIRRPLWATGRTNVASRRLPTFAHPRGPAIFVPPPVVFEVATSGGHDHVQWTRPCAENIHQIERRKTKAKNIEGLCVDNCSETAALGPETLTESLVSGNYAGCTEHQVRRLFLRPFRGMFCKKTLRNCSPWAPRLGHVHWTRPCPSKMHRIEGPSGHGRVHWTCTKLSDKNKKTNLNLSSSVRKHVPISQHAHLLQSISRFGDPTPPKLQRYHSCESMYLMIDCLKGT